LEPNFLPPVLHSRLVHMFDLDYKPDLPQAADTEGRAA
jgi:hypothetical protein